jgi:hypothetical protein
MITEVKKTLIVLNIRFIFTDMQLLHKLAMKFATAFFKSSPSLRLHVISTSFLEV